jgi:hypothetical protein
VLRERRATSRVWAAEERFSPCLWCPSTVRSCPALGDVERECAHCVCWCSWQARVRGCHRLFSAVSLLPSSDPCPWSCAPPVYDITNTPNAHANEAIKTLNRFTRDTFGLGGIFHGAVEVNGEEWSFGASRPLRVLP